MTRIYDAYLHNGYRARMRKLLACAAAAIAAGFVYGALAGGHAWW